MTPEHRCYAETQRNLYDGVAIDEVYKAAILAARTLHRDRTLAYSTRHRPPAAAHHPPRDHRRRGHCRARWQTRYADYFPGYIKKGIQAELLDERLAQYDLARLGAALKADRDLQFDYLGLQTLYDRYFLHVEDVRIEMPQAFFMRVAMGLALNEIDREDARDRVLRGAVVASTSCRQHADAVQLGHPPLAALVSCYLTTVSDDLDGIYEAHEGERAAVQVRRRPGQ